MNELFETEKNQRRDKNLWRKDGEKIKKGAEAKSS